MQGFVFKSLCFVAVAVSATAAFAQSPFAGTWKLNAEKSHFTGDIMTFAPAADGGIKYTAEDQSYTFKTDGKEYSSVTNAQHVWKKIDDHSYQSVTSRNGMTLGTATWKVSADEKTLTVEDTGTSPDGKPFDDTSMHTRVSGTAGLMGSWKSTEVKMKEDEFMTWKAADGGAIRWELPAIKAYVILSFDGKDCTPVGPTVPAGLTLKATKTGASSFSVMEDMNGKMLEKMSYSLSADGKTLKETSAPPDGKAPATSIYEKQSM